MSGVRDTFERNKEGLNDLFLKCKNEITENFNNLMAAGQFDNAMDIINNQISAAILEFEHRRANVRQILDTKLKLSFDAKNVTVVTEWENAVTTVRSQIEMLADTFKVALKERLTEAVGVPAIEKFLIDAANKKAFTRLPFDFIAKKLGVPENKVEEVAENLIFDGRLPARIDVVSRMLLFSDIIEKMDVLASSPQQAPLSVPPAPTPQPIPPAPRPQPISPEQPTQDMPQLIDLDSPQPIDLSLEPPEPEITEEILETPPAALDDLLDAAGIDKTGLESIESVEVTPATQIPDISLDKPSILPTTESVDTSSPISSAEETPQEPSVSMPSLSEEEEEARSIISFFKSSVEEISEEEREAARAKREEKKRALEEAKKKKLEAETEAPKPPEISTPPQGDLSSLITPKTAEAPIPPEKAVSCVICLKPVSKDDPSVVPCPHACGAFAHKTELLEKGFCPNCNEEVKDVDIEFSTLL